MSEREKYTLKLDIGHIAEQIGEYDEKKPDQAT